MRETTIEFFTKDTFFVPDAFTRAGGVWPLRIGQTIAKPNYKAGPRAIQYYNIHFVMDGQVELIFDLKRVVMSKGDAFCMFPGILYQYHIVPSDKPLQMLWVSFDGAQAPTLLIQAGFLETAPYLRQVMTKELSHALHNLLTSSNDGFRQQLEQQSSLYRIFSYLMSSEVSPATIPSSGFAHWVSKSIEYMNTHYMERITVQDVAAYATVHRAYFSKIFTQQVGMSPIRYLERLKMEKAIELLQHTSYAISEISLTLGYPDPYTFTRAFSRYYKIPPGKWRSTQLAPSSEQL